MTLTQLIKKLLKIKGNPQIILASDAEGNSFGQLDEIYAPNDLKVAQTENGITILDEHDIKEGGFKRSKPCIILYPK